ncbi:MULTISPECIES: DUF2802 domain-containing protein [Marichromatium]|uniref:Uncharacterized protein DUF2802 n=1 Tax=Marichromatium gracile TaxID=1048 RepID=A0A4R4A5D8_MARGR|nr:MULTISPECIES: DUF2802 domain-containing protein [Marichromatium]MBO8086809.1 DUF2802 domain-containing protein [Marichromatium sp.]MBK1708137.1 hypothetical protein [Marichromatium gracile]RNE89627.1 DUF2802 domain-containing protein [Marichromatium sp. AB31]RNE94706.1 DUF2802 domain-containing protein [Marichromatium sp. AB32]TCW33434.1 uncharacterized protein DUF2802 [Marichromatium gracile]
MISLAEILAILALLAAALALAAFVYLWRETRRLRRDLRRFDPVLQTLHRDLRVIAGESFHRGQDRVMLVNALERLADQQQEMRLEMRMRDADQSPYAQAIKLIRNGQSREQVRRLCALTDAELELLFGLHGHGIGGEYASDRLSDTGS